MGNAPCLQHTGGKRSGRDDHLVRPGWRGGWLQLATVQWRDLPEPPIADEHQSGWICLVRRRALGQQVCSVIWLEYEYARLLPQSLAVPRVDSVLHLIQCAWSMKQEPPRQRLRRQ